MKNYKTIVSYIFLIIFLYVFYSYVQDNIELLNEITSIQIGYIGALLIISFFNYAIKA